MSDADADADGDVGADADANGAGGVDADAAGQEVEYGYTEWRCTNCGRTTPRQNPPCSRCGNMRFERVEVRASDFDDEIRAASTLELLRENPRPVAAAAVVLLVAALVALASAGVLVLADPFGLGYRFGAVDAVADDGDGTLTAAELHGRVAAEYGGASMRWYGRGLELSFTTTAESNAAVAAELTRVAEWYAEYVADGGEAASLRITVDVANAGRGRVVVDRADAAAFAAGDISRAEYRSRVLASSRRG
jgi:hypothetical protein